MLLIAIILNKASKRNYKIVIFKMPGIGEIENEI